MERELDSAVWGERLGVCRCEYDTQTQKNGLNERKITRALVKLTENMTHSITADDIPLRKRLSKVLFLSIWHFFTTSIITKREFILTWRETQKDSEAF